MAKHLKTMPHRKTHNAAHNRPKVATTYSSAWYNNKSQCVVQYHKETQTIVTWWYNTTHIMQYSTTL